MTVADVLSAPAEFDHEYTVRSVGPCAILVLELEAPMRAEYVASTDSEFDALVAWAREHDLTRHVLDAFYAAKSIEEGTEAPLGWSRESAHARRLSSGQRIATTRAAS